MLRRKGVRVVSITEHADDSPTGKLMEAIIESVDEFYSENLATEVLRGMREAASRGFWVSSHAPFGYNRIMVPDGPKKRPTLEINPDTSRIVRRIFDLAEAGKGTLEITRILNNEGIASPRSLAGKPLAGFRATPDRRIIALFGIIVSVIRFKNPQLHRQLSLRKRRLGENRGFRPSF